MVLMTKEIGFKSHYSIRRSFFNDSEELGYALQFCHGWVQGATDGYIGTYRTIDECKLVAQAKFEEWVRATFFCKVTL